MILKIIYTGRHNTASSTNSHRKDPETGPGASHDFNNQGPPDTYNSEMTGTNTIDAGPHDSKVANKLDPRVDSDLGKSRKMVYRRKPIIEIY